jgi:hypothetical protein
MPPRHCERSEAIHCAASGQMDCFVASLLAMTKWDGKRLQNTLAGLRLRWPPRAAARCATSMSLMVSAGFGALNR